MTHYAEQLNRRNFLKYFIGSLKHLAATRRKMLWVLTGLVLFMGALGFFTHDAIEDALQDVLEKNLHAIIEADVTALTIWMENEKEAARLWAERTVLSSEVQDLLETASLANEHSREALLASPDQRRLRELLKINPQDQKDRGFMIIDRTGLILASDDDRFIGLRLNADGMRILGLIFEQNVYISHPFREGELIAEISFDPRKTSMLAAAAVKNEFGRPIAAVVFLIDPEQDFTRILSVARIGETGNTYAFNNQGVLLSDSRFEEELNRLGLLANGPEAESILNLRIRDPGGDLTKNYRPKLPREQWPLTRMAAAAIAGKDGINVYGYRDYRGVEVAGAWRWLPQYELGVASEVSLEEALKVIRPLLFAYRILFVLLVMTVAAIVITYMIIYRLRLSIHEAQQIDRYRLESKIGEGGMGEVYRARHQFLRRPTAIKLLRPDKVTPETLARFEREVQQSSRLSHPNTIVIYDYGRTPEGIFYYVMEYLDGITLAGLIEMEGALPPARAIHILRQICASLKEAHGAGLIHRDIKPPNIILSHMGGEPDFVKVLDFGLVREIELPDEQNVTKTHVIQGTPLYIAPERLRDPRNIDARSDIYSLGVVGYNLLTGRDLHEGANALEINYHTLNTPPPRPSENSPHAVPAALDELIARCLAKNPDERPETVLEIINVLDAIAKKNPWNWQEAAAWWQRNAERIRSAHADSRTDAASDAVKDSKTLNMRRDAGN